MIHASFPRHSAARSLTTKSRRWSRPFTFALVLGALFACNGIRHDELSCEEAVSRLSECCAGFRASNVDCSYTASQGCGTFPTYPQIGLTASECIRSQSCDSLQSSGVCDRAAMQPAAQPQDDEGGFVTVCP